MAKATLKKGIEEVIITGQMKDEFNVQIQVDLASGIPWQMTSLTDLSTSNNNVSNTFSLLELIRWYQ